ncbi:MAG: hypothetical protein D6771_06240, partial [Zetaproteobacteria bacterium]
PAATWLADAQGRLLYANPVWMQAFAKAVDPFASAHYVEALSPDLRARLEKAHSEALQGDAAHLRWQDEKGRVWDLVLASVPRGSDPVVVGIAVDVSAQVREAELRAALQHWETIGRIAGGVAHDFNNLLAVIMGSLDLAQDQLKRGETSEMAGHLEMALDAAERAARLVRQLLSASGYRGFEQVLLDPQKHLAGMRELLSAMVGGRARVVWRLDAAPSIRINPGQFEQIVTNLVLNAAEAVQSKGGTIELSLRPGRFARALCGKRRDAEGNFVRCLCEIEDAEREGAWIEVADDGVGMEEEVLDKALEPFYSTHGLGRGLGLSAVYGIARAMGGALVIETKPKVGTRVRVWLPAAS